LNNDLKGGGATERAQGHVTLVAAGVGVRQVLKCGLALQFDRTVILCGRPKTHQGGR